jgi:hypothetical protein
MRGLPRLMIFAFLDEFGHNGPFIHRDHPKHNTSPVFGLAGYLIPENQVRHFGTFFLKRKAELLSHDIQRAGKQAYEWEKKGTNLFTANSIVRYPEIRSSMFRMMNEIKSRDGKIFYYGREKIKDRFDLNANGLYKTIFSHSIRQINSYCESKDENFVIVLDENSARKELLETAAKTMFGSDPAKRMLSPPFEVESYLNQNIQAADWIATIVGRLWNNRLDPDGFANYSSYNKYFWQRLHAVATHSSVMKRSTPASENRATESARKVGSLGRALLAAQAKKQDSSVIIREIETVTTIQFSTDGEHGIKA